jgi:alanine racemase
MNSRKTFALIDLSAYMQNLHYLSRKASPAKLRVVVKADAYGHGAVELSRAARDIGIEQLAVAFLEEGNKIREGGVDLPILILNYVDRHEIPIARKFGLTPTLCSFGQLDEIFDLEVSLPDFHIVVDT